MSENDKEDLVTYFPVGEADMTLVELRDGSVFLIDTYLQEEDVENRPTIDTDLIDRLPTDEDGRPYVDVFLLTHPDQDHCKGAEDYLHLADPADYSEEGDIGKIFVCEMWSSPLIFRRSSKNHTLCSDAKAINKEAKRRVEAFRNDSAKSSSEMPLGDRILILGDDYKKDGEDRLSDLSDIHIGIGECISKSEGGNSLLEVKILAPISPDGEEDEEILSKNNSSVVSQWTIFAGSPNNGKNCKLLFGGDAEVEIWRRLQDAHEDDNSCLEYDILLAPHHCSWGVLSDEAAEDEANVDEMAKEALNFGQDAAYIVASSRPIEDNEAPPPAQRAKDEYLLMLDDHDHFYCLGSHPDNKNPEPLTFTLTDVGPKPPSKKSSGNPGRVAAAVSETPRPHGN